MIHHVGVFASDLDLSRRIYGSALRPLGIIVGYETDRVAELWREEDDTPSLSLERGDSFVTSGCHIAFEAQAREAVDAFFREGVQAGAEPRHHPKYWEEYSAYAAFLTDPDGNNIEAVHKEG